MEPIKFKENWISVNDINKPPPLKTPVLVAGTPIGITVGFYWGEETVYKNPVKNDPCKGWSIMGVTHWSPMVEGP